jgi:hypothetical protein
MNLGVKHADRANITGDGLQSLRGDPSVQGAQGRIIAQITRDSRYGKEAFTLSNDPSERFAANGPGRNFVSGLVTSNPAFLMVHTAKIYATNTKVSADGTISTTWKVDDQFDYVADWGNHDREGFHYWAYNIGAEISSLIYYDLLRAKKQVKTTASWKQTICKLCK